MIELTTEQKELLSKCVLDQMQKFAHDPYLFQKYSELLVGIKEDLNTQRPEQPT